MPTITFNVIDTSCETADQSFFPPKVTMTTRSTTQIATVLGFPEYPQFVSKPPKRYKRLTWQGTSKHSLFWLGTDGQSHFQVASAQIDYNGTSEIDSKGNYISLYQKNLSLWCDKVLPQFYYTSVPFQIGEPPGFVLTYNFLGWCGPPAGSGQQFCPPCDPTTPVTFFQNVAVGKGDTAILDSSPLWGSFQNSLNIGIGISNFVAQSSTSATCVDSAGPGQAPFAIPSFFTAVRNGQPNPPFAPSTVFGGSPEWNHNYSATLDTEYTDAEALANAQVFQGNGATAQNFPRTTGFVSSFTNVIFTLTFTSLIVGKNYTASVDFWDPQTGITTTRQYGIMATKTIQGITDIVPTPLPGHLLQVRNPKITFIPQ